MSFLGSVAKFLESQGMVEDALAIATDLDYKFDLAIQLGRLETAKVKFIPSLLFFCVGFTLHPAMWCSENTPRCGFTIENSVFSFMSVSLVPLRDDA